MNIVYDNQIGKEGFNNIYFNYNNNLLFQSLFNSNISFHINTNDIKEGSNNKYYPSQLLNNIDLNLDTDQIKQGKSNLYVSDFILNFFANSNLNSNFTTDDFYNLNSTSNFFFNSNIINSSFNNITTDNIKESSTRSYLKPNNSNNIISQISFNVKSEKIKMF